MPDDRRPRDWVRPALARRAFDLGVTALVLPFTLVVGALIALAVVIDSPGPVFYRSTRIGRAGVPFEMLKFRTMRHPASGPLLTSHEDDRQTPFGRVLAASRLDELPQLWNVVRGEMRLVGPRPEVRQFVDAQSDSYRTILSVPPGLTGPTQLAFAGEGRVLAAAADREHAYCTDILPAKVESDLAYVETATMWRDLAVIARTLLVPLRRGDHARQGSGTGWRDSAPAAGTAVGAVALVALFVAEAGGMPW